MTDLIYHPESDTYFIDDFEKVISTNSADCQMCCRVTDIIEHRQEAARRGVVLPHAPPPDFYFGLPVGAELVFDLETFPNCFTCTVKNRKLGLKYVFEISDRRNDLYTFCHFIELLKQRSITMVGFNILHFDYPVVHFIYNNASDYLTAAHIYDKAMQIINAEWNARFAHVIWENDWLFDLVDLFKVHHFDNKSKATSLKILEVHMQMDSVEDLPFPVGTVLTHEQMDVLLEYNEHDVDATELFLDKSRAQLDLRRELSAKYDENFMNYSDVKIGERILIIALENAGVEVYTWANGRKEKRQTKRSSINLGEVIFPYIQLERFEFQNIMQRIAQKTISVRDIEEDDRLNTKGVFTDLTAFVDGIEYKFGTGGLHGSVDNRIVVSDDAMQLVDVDVAGYYPNLGIANGLYPEHLGPIFCEVYKRDVVDARAKYPKKTPLNEAFKLAGNGAYGGSNNEFSPLLDPKYTMSITINGQLLLCMLIEQLVKVPGLQMIQANTDGVTYLCPREYLEHTRAVQKWWEGVTGLKLEEALYRRMFIRDVNSYIAEKEDGSLKRIGAYAYVTALEDPGTRELPWHKDWSARIVQMAAQAALVRGVPVESIIRTHLNPHDFLLRTKVPRSSILEYGGKQVANTVRYYVSTDGERLEKVMPAAGSGYKRKNGISDADYYAVVHEYAVQGFVDIPWDERIHTKNKSRYDERRTALQAGWNVRLCNNIADFDRSKINYDWYIAEARKLVDTLRY